MNADAEDDTLDVAALEAAGFRRLERPNKDWWGWADTTILSGPEMVAAIVEPLGCGRWRVALLAADLRVLRPVEVSRTSTLQALFGAFDMLRRAAAARPARSSGQQYRRPDPGEQPLDQFALRTLGFEVGLRPDGVLVGAWVGPSHLAVAAESEKGHWRVKVLAADRAAEPAWHEVATRNDLMRVFTTSGVHPLHYLAVGARSTQPGAARSRGARTARASGPPRPPGRSRRW